jgi:lysophospholipase L1-like esterase
MTRAILCYGDSNTWGSDPADEMRRFPSEVRWPGVLRRELGDGHEVYEEGLGGRTTAFDRLPAGFRSGRDLLAPVLETHAPLDLVILLLGTNDVSLAYVDATDIARGMGELVGIVQRSDETGGPRPGIPPQVLVVAPPVVGPLLPEDLPWYAGAIERSRALPDAYREMAQRMHCHFFDLSPVVTTSPLDGWHWEAAEHAKAGAALAAEVRTILDPQEQP